MMDYQVLHGTTFIGETNLEYRDATMGVAHGVFSPSRFYTEVQHVFRLFAQAIQTQSYEERERRLKQYYISRDLLHLEMQKRDGTVIATSAIHIIDPTDHLETRDGEPGDYYIEVIVPDPAFFK